MTILPNIEEAMEDARNGKLSPYWQNNLKRECLHRKLSAEERQALSELNRILSETPQWSGEEELCIEMENIGGRVRFCHFWDEHYSMVQLTEDRNGKYSAAYTLNSAEDLTEDEQIEWFEVLNNAGSRVSIIQMRFSKLKAHGIDIYKQYTNLYRTRVYEAGYEDFFTPQKTNVSYPVAALNPAYEVITQKPHSGNYAPIPSDTKENQLCNLSPEQLTQCFSMTLAALDRTLDFINENTPTQLPRIDYINYLLGYFIFHNEVLTEDNKEKLLQWMDNVDFTNKSNSERRDIFTALIT